jgi:hypothetical protein
MNWFRRGARSRGFSRELVLPVCAELLAEEFGQREILGGLDNLIWASSRRHSNRFWHWTRFRLS